MLRKLCPTDQEEEAGVTPKGLINMKYERIVLKIFLKEKLAISRKTKTSWEPP